MTDTDCDRVADFIRTRVLDGGYAKKIGGLVSGENLRAFTDLNIELAEIDGKLVGYLSWQITYSTWRGSKGLYINDHYASDNNVAVLNALMNHAIGRSITQGASYIRTEVDITEEHIAAAYSKAGFWHAIRRAQYYLEPQAFSDYVQELKIVPLA
jgi:ribosomal protein S18 acetylase RimI-like enzyme